MNWQHLWDFIIYMFVEPILANPLIVRTQFIKYIYIFFWCYNSTFFIVEWNWRMMHKGTYNWNVASNLDIAET